MTGITMRMSSVLIISPFTTDRAALEELLRSVGHRVTSADSFDHGIAVASAVRPDVVIADARLAELDGRMLVHRLARHAVPPRVILLCSRPSRALDHLGVVCLVKPIDVSRLYELVMPARAVEAVPA